MASRNALADIPLELFSNGRLSLAHRDRSHHASWQDGQSGSLRQDVTCRQTRQSVRRSQMYGYPHMPVDMPSLASRRRDYAAFEDLGDHAP